MDCFSKSDWYKKNALPEFARYQPAAPIESDMLRRLIQLCHPDKHAGSESAGIATRYLLGLKNEAKHALY